MSILVFTDGAAKGNPGPGGWGAIVATPDGRVRELGGGSPHTTNNQMELTGVIEALRAHARRRRHDRAAHRLDLRHPRHHRVDPRLAPARLEDRRGPAGAQPRAVGSARRAGRRARPRRRSAGTTCAATPTIPGNERADDIAVAFAAGKSARPLRRPARRLSGRHPRAARRHLAAQAQQRLRPASPAPPSPI